MLPFIEEFAKQDLFKTLEDSIKTNGYCLYDIKSLYGSSKAVALQALIERKRIQTGLHFIIVAEREDALQIYGDLTGLLNSDRVLFLPTSYKKESIIQQKDNSAEVQRTIALKAISDFTTKQTTTKQTNTNNTTTNQTATKPLSEHTPYLVIVTYLDALYETVQPIKQIKESCLRISIGDNIPFSLLKEILGNAGFIRQDFVSVPGEYSIRGSIVDIFSYSNNLPYRISFFGDEVETIRYFDINTQNSIQKTSYIDIIKSLTGEELENENSEDLNILNILPKETYLWTDDFRYLKEKSKIPLPQCIDIPAKFSILPQPAFSKNFNVLADDIYNKKNDGYTIYILSDNTSQIERLNDIFKNFKVKSEYVNIMSIALNKGFYDTNAKICVYTDHEIFERIHRVRLIKAVDKSERLTINDLNGLRIGDYVVHIDHGIGIFGGLIRTNTDGKIQEFIRINYANNDTLLVNIHGLNRISKYRSKDSTIPKITTLSSKSWQSLKNKTKKKLKELAVDLIKLYAQRCQQKGFAFSADTYLQQELEASFMFEDTPDQLKATEDVKADMEQPYPMDRLICGDVGFGKTEIAVRAALKAVADGKQVAMLVPTTILALQHYKTFSDRLKDFGVNVDYVSRLKNSAQIKESLQKLKAGKIDILIGTHRLLNNDVLFKDLGLLIIDEEQKFGVAAKEKLRQIKTNIDTLTLTATPIPRTLQFSLMGARDISYLQTPPANRLPVYTELLPFNADFIKNVINKEIARGGQVFFLHNKVQDIESIADILHSLCPNIRIAVGHGQMEPKKLESVLLNFIYGDYDLLLATSIIENGVDIPNVNTIIVNNAQNFGLSDLHQVRGRVGRSNRQAYCYLLVPSLTTITDDARRRLNAIETFQELGSGFNIAMQDLDIRGAGNLLGGEQSGFIADMGFETYQKILNEAMVELNLSINESGAEDTAITTGERVKESIALPNSNLWVSDCSIETDLEVYIPEDYIQQITEKMRIYRDLNNVKSILQLEKLEESLEDRFGKMPLPVKELTNVVRLKLIGVKLGFEKIVIKNGIMLAYFIQDPNSGYYQSKIFGEIMEGIKNQHGKFELKNPGIKLLLRSKGVESIENAYNLMKYFVKR